MNKTSSQDPGDFSTSVRVRPSDGGAFIVDRHGTILGFDERMERLTGWPAVEIVGCHKDRPGSWCERGVGASKIVSAPLYDGAIPVPESSSTAELKLHCRDGRTVDAEVLTNLLPGKGTRVAVSILRLLARSSDSRASGRSDGRDPLTDLYDRDTFVRRLRSAFDAASSLGRPLALIIADVDRLRTINDEMGREAGDQVLRKIAGILRATVDHEHGIARLGDDEFALMFSGAGRGDARQVAARLRSTVERFRFFATPGQTDPVAVTLTLGAASYPADADNDVELLQRAWEALDQARLFGRNRVWCYTRRPRVPLEVPVYFDSADAPLVGISRDLSPSGLFVQTSSPLDIGMRCALAFPLPGHDGKVHVVGRVVRTVPFSSHVAPEIRTPGMGVEFERLGANDREVIEAFLFKNESVSLRPEDGRFSF